MRIQIAFFVLLAILSITLTACENDGPAVNNRWTNQNSGNNNEQNQQKNVESEKILSNKVHSTIVDSNNQFAFDLYAKLRAREGNQFFSPYSISSALAMTLMGARGETEKQMISALHLPADQQQIFSGFAAISKNLNNPQTPGAYQLNIANALWSQAGFDLQKDFVGNVEKTFDASVSQLDFKNDPENSRIKINQWVQEQTKGKIIDLFAPESITPDTGLVLANAIYFKGNWISQFKKEATQNADFNLTAKKKITAPLMFQNAEFNFLENDRYQALQLNYQGDEISMIVYLPRKIESLSSLEQLLTAELLTTDLKKMNKRKVDVYLPKFKMTAQYNLNESLAALGMRLPFAKQADFSGISGAPNLFINAVVHKAYVDVNEEGTEAAAATGVGVTTTSLPPPPPVFRADHPFLFFIQDNRSKSILFMGRVVDPLAEK